MRKMIYGLALIVFTLSISYGKANAAEALGFDVSGFVDASYFVDDNADSNTFGLDQVEIDIEKEIKDWASVRLDLQHCPSGSQASCAGSGGDDSIEQGYLTLTAPVGSGVTFTFGKFNAPIGFELLDAPDMYQFSHALVFDNGLPTNLTGLMASGALGDMIDISAYVVNGWDNNPDTNKNKSFGGRIGITPMKDVNVGFSAITGDDSAVAGENMTVFDVDGTITMIPNLTVGLEFNFGNEDLASTTGTDADWFGFLVMGHYDYSDWGGITVRYDYFDDEDGARLGTANNTQQAITIAPTFVIGEGFGALIEYRHDSSDKDVFTKSDGRVTDNNDTFACEMTYSF
jgi:hypothetical protein